MNLPPNNNVRVIEGRKVRGAPSWLVKRMEALRRLPPPTLEQVETSFRASERMRAKSEGSLSIVKLKMKPKYVGQFMGSRVYRMGECQVHLSGPKERAQIGWHFSISHPNRNPTWEEQRDFRYSEIPDDVYMVSIMPPKREYVNVHKFCFHWHEAGPKFFDVKTGRPLP